MSRARCWVAAALLLSGAGCTCAEPRTDLPRYEATRASAAVTIDGRLDDAVWDDAPWTEPFVNTMTGAPAHPRSRAKLAWDADYLYAAFEVEDDYLRADLTGHDPHLWTQDTVELMIDPDGDGLNYFELQLAPSGQTFDTRYDSRRIPQPFGHVGWDSELHGEVAVRGTLNDEDGDEGYTAELRIPWEAFAAGQTPAEPPSAGDTWRLALYVLDIHPEGQGGVGWSPPLIGDFHVPERFGHLVFAGP